MFFRHAVFGLASLSLLAAPMTPEARKLHLESFEKVWSTVATRHYDPKLGGLDWKGIHEEFKPKIEKAVSAEEVHDLLNAMLGRLGQSHLGVMPMEAYEEDGGSENLASAVPGFDVRPVQGRVLVTSVEPDSPAAKAGVKPGWELLEVGDKPVKPVVERLSAHLKQSTQLELMLTLRMHHLLRKGGDKPMSLRFGTGKGAVALQVARMEPKGRVVRFSNLPPTSFWLERRTLPGSVAYLKFNIWLEPEAVVQGFQQAFDEAKPCKGFILDLRGNPGGMGFLATGAAGWFVNAAHLKLGTMQMRQGNLNFVILPRANAFQGPLAILVDGCSASTSEIFAGGMQDLGRARIFGGRSAGAALPSIIERLPNGDGFQYIIANYLSEKGYALEGRGVKPDEEVPLSQAELLKGRDPALEQALAWIARQ